jgi:hypothetical protein
MNQLTQEKRVRVLAALVEGNSVRSTIRITGVAKNTVIKLLRDVGATCQEYHDKIMVGLPCKRIQVPESCSKSKEKPRGCRSGALECAQLSCYGKP